jgi:Ubiquitin-activating enzyme active site
MANQTGPPPRHRTDDLELGSNIAHRLEDFAASVIHLSTRLPKDAAGQHVVIQWSAPRRAPAPTTRRPAPPRAADFVHKAAVALKEVREARYWLALVQKSGWVQGSLTEVVREANELAAILGASVRTARARASADRRAR